MFSYKNKTCKLGHSSLPTMSPPGRGCDSFFKSLSPSQFPVRLLPHVHEVVHSPHWHRCIRYADNPVSNQWHITHIICPVHLLPSTLNFVHTVTVCHSHTDIFANSALCHLLLNLHKHHLLFHLAIIIYPFISLQIPFFFNISHISTAMLCVAINRKCTGWHSTPYLITAPPSGSDNVESRMPNWQKWLYFQWPIFPHGLHQISCYLFYFIFLLFFFFFVAILAIMSMIRTSAVCLWL